MNQNTKNVMGWVGVAGIVIVAIAVWNFTAAYSRSVPPVATFSVTGQGKSVGVPDVAEFTFSITNEGGTDIASLQKDNTTKANAAIDFLKSQSVDPKDIETQGYDIQPRYQSYSCSPTIYNVGPALEAGSSGGSANSASPAIAPVRPCPPASIVGYTVTETVQVKVRDFSKTGDIIAGVTAKGANSVSGLTFTVDNPSQLQGDARGKAIADAKTQAENMAKAGGFSLGRLIGVSENGSSPMTYKSYALDSQSTGSGAVPAAAPTIQPGSQEMNAQVTLTYEIR